VETTILAHAGDIQLTLLCGKTKIEAARRASTSWHAPGRGSGGLLYSSAGENLEQIVLYYLGLRQATLAVAEAAPEDDRERITSVPGSSRSFLAASSPIRTT